MFPSKKEWGEWSSFERASYVAQVLVPISLLVTVLFSFLGWREARRAYETQLELFWAQNSPEVVVAEVSFYRAGGLVPTMIVTVQNVGQSKAEGICVFAEWKTGSVFETYESVEINCADDDTFIIDNSLAPGQSTSIPFADTSVIKTELGFVPTDAKLYQPGLDQFDTCFTVLPEVRATLVVGYRDALGKRYQRSRVVVFCAPDKSKTDVSER